MRQRLTARTSIFEIRAKHEHPMRLQSLMCILDDTQQMLDMPEVDLMD